MGCFSGLLKYILILFNLVFVIAGIALIVISGIYINDKGKAIDELNGIAIFAIIVGSFIFLVAFFGCCGAVKESPCLLTTYAVILIVLFILEMSVGIWALVKVNNEEDFAGLVRKALKNVVDNYYENDSYREFIDEVQKENHCCGVEGFQDYPLGKVPDSCELQYYIVGCFDIEKENIQKFMRAVGGVAIAFAVVEILGASFAFYLSSQAKKRHRYV